jgi:hypothetical protein
MPAAKPAATKPAAKPRPIKTMFTIRNNWVTSFVKHFDDFLLDDTDTEEESELAAIRLQEDEAQEEAILQLYTSPVNRLKKEEDSDDEEDSGSDTDGSADEEDKPGFNWEKPFYIRRDGDEPAFSTLFGVLEGPQEKPDDYVAPVVVVSAATVSAATLDDIKVEEMRRVLQEKEEDFLDRNIKEDTEDDNIKVEEMDRVLREREH